MRLTGVTIPCVSCPFVRGSSALLSWSRCHGQDRTIRGRAGVRENKKSLLYDILLSATICGICELNISTHALYLLAFVAGAQLDGTGRSRRSGIPHLYDMCPTALGTYVLEKSGQFLLRRVLLD